jgi:putative tryptophan/tyrosine transport system substrate-binding protein
LPALAQELVALRPDVIIAVAGAGAIAAAQASSGIPIVMSPATDPIGLGLVKSFAHPGGNVTGWADMYGDSIGTAVEILHELIPTAKKVAVLMSGNATHPAQYELALTHFQSLGASGVPFLARIPGVSEDHRGGM